MRRCLGCFEEKRDDLEVCPFCGYIDGTTAEEAVHIEPGTILSGRYIIGKVLGYGGFGVTYIGWDSRLEQKVAIKEYLPSEFSTRMPGQSRVTIFNGVKNEQYVSGLNKFVEEAKKLSKFQKEDGIVKIYDCIAENDTAYIIMEYLEGEPLSERLKREKIIPEEEAIGILIPVMKSLEIVHKEGIIHRDISPDNIFLLNDGRVKLIDFGAARYATTSHSRSLTVIIKPGYSAEEQYRSNGDQGPHTDVYSLAAVLYRMLTGQTPPDALERRSKVESIKKDILIEPHSLNKSISQVTENAILNALNIRIEDRTPTVNRFIADLMAEKPVRIVRGKINGIDLYRMPIWLKILVPVTLIGLIVIGLTLRIESPFKRQVDVPEGYVAVPNVEGMDIDNAISALQEVGLSYISGGNAIVDYIDANTIVYQIPEVGRMVPQGSSIELVVSKGSGDIVLPSNGIATVPAFLWGEVEEVVNDFTTAGIETNLAYVYAENIQPGQVMSVLDDDENALSDGEMIGEDTIVTLQVATDEIYIDRYAYYHVGDRTLITRVIGDLPREITISSISTDGYAVDGLASYSFADNDSITSVVIPDGVVSIGYNAFEGCSLLTDLTIPDSVSSISEGAFANCPSLNNINGMQPEMWIAENGFDQSVFDEQHLFVPRLENNGWGRRES